MYRDLRSNTSYFFLAIRFRRNPQNLFPTLALYLRSISGFRPVFPERRRSVSCDPIEYRDSRFRRRNARIGRAVGEPDCPANSCRPTQLPICTRGERCVDQNGVLESGRANPYRRVTRAQANRNKWPEAPQPLRWENGK